MSIKASNTILIILQLPATNTISDSVLYKEVLVQLYEAVMITTKHDSRATPN